jgi:hypothetical protein
MLTASIHDERMFTVKRPPNRLLAAAAIAAASATAAILPGPSLAASGRTHRAATPATATPKGGAIRLFASGISQAKSKTTVTGVIGDYGFGITQDKNGKPDPEGDYEKVVLSHGSFIVDETGLDKALRAHANVQLNHSTCSFVFSGTGPATIGSGTGAYAGITGTVSITINVADIAPHKGASCNLNVPGKGTYGTVTGTGTVSFK